MSTLRTYPRHIRVRYIKILRNLGDGHGHGEEVKGIPRPAHETRSEHEPLVGSQLSQDGNWVSQFVL